MGLFERIIILLAMKHNFVCSFILYNVLIRDFIVLESIGHLPFYPYSLVHQVGLHLLTLYCSKWLAHIVLCKRLSHKERKQIADSSTCVLMSTYLLFLRSFFDYTSATHVVFCRTSCACELWGREMASLTITILELLERDFVESE